MVASIRFCKMSDGHPNARKTMLAVQPSNIFDFIIVFDVHAGM